MRQSAWAAVRRTAVRTWLGAAAAGLLVAGGLVSCSDSGPGCETGLVDTTSGTVCGAISDVIDLEDAQTDVFVGIPFAESTAGANRWQPPIPKARMPGVFSATAIPPACPQTLDPPFGPTSGTSEDCLTVNVWRPQGIRAGRKLPVMVWIYGGSFRNGGTSVPVYNGGYLAAKNGVVVVTLNYRLGALGFLSGTDGLTGNYGLLDQQLAFEWVRDNAEAFGGDPEKITIFGESAGAMSVGLHMMSIPSSTGLFRAGIMQSNPLGIPYKTLAQSVPIGAAFKQAVGCGGQGLDCLRSVSADAIVAAQVSTELQLLSLYGSKLAGFLVFDPVIDGGFVVQDPTIAAQDGTLDLPTVLGTTHDEGTIFVAEVANLLGGTISEANYVLLLTLLFGADDVPKIVAVYGSNPGGDNTAILSRIATDYLFGCANRFVARQARSSVHAYEFDETSLNIWQGQVPACDNEACHGDDVPFTFHVDQPLGFTFTPDQAKLSDEMVGYWGAFATGLDPNRSGLLSWPEFTPSGLEYLILDTPALSTAVNPIPNCDFWDGIGYDLGVTFEALAARAAQIAGPR
jgi:carboxylesterase type B